MRKDYSLQYTEFEADYIDGAAIWHKYDLSDACQVVKPRKNRSAITPAGTGWWLQLTE